MTHYAALVMIISFVVEFLLLMAAGRACGCSLQWENTVLAAAIGGLYAGLCLLPGLSYMTALYCRGFVLLLMAVLTFGISRQLLWGGAIFLLLNIAMENLTPDIQTERLWKLLLCAFLILLLYRNASGGAGKGTVPVEILHNGIQLRLTALRDTGNSLKDPVSGKSVLIIGADAAKQLTGLTRVQLGTPVDTITTAGIPGLRLVPYHTIGQRGGFLLALKLQNVKIANKEESRLVAFAPEGLGREMKYQALTGGII